VGGIETAVARRDVGIAAGPGAAPASSGAPDGGREPGGAPPAAHRRTADAGSRTASRAARPGPGGDAMSRSGAVTDRRAAVAADHRVAGGRRRGQDPARGRGQAGTQWPADRRGSQDARNGAGDWQTVTARAYGRSTRKATPPGTGWAAITV
jgi:hypothetical protein